MVNRSLGCVELEAETERQWVARAMRGDPGAFARLYQRHVDAVYHYIHFRVRDVATAEDLTQDVFTSAYKGMAQLKAEDKFKHWLLRIAHNRVLNHWRARASAPPPSELPLDTDSGAWPGPAQAALADDGQMAAAETRLAAGDVLAALGQLTDLQQQVIALRFVAGLSVAETAAVMERSMGAVKNLQHHALATLRRAALPPESIQEGSA